jgi:hypothetical protein
MIVRIVHMQNVEPVDADALQALLDRLADTVVAEVPHRSPGRDLLIEGDSVVVLGVIARGPLAQQPPHLGRDDQSGRRRLRDGLPRALLGQPVPVQRGGIDVAHPARQRATDHVHGVGVADRLQEVPKGGRPQADSRHEEIGVPDPNRRRMRDHEFIQSRGATADNAV